MKENDSNASQAFYLYPLDKPFCAPHYAQPDCFQRNTGSTLRVMPTLMCARVTSLDSAQALPKYREGSGFSPSSPTAGVTLPDPRLGFSPLRTRPRRELSLDSPHWSTTTKVLLKYSKS